MRTEIPRMLSSRLFSGFLAQIRLSKKTTHYIMSKRINRIAIFVDHDNFVSNFKRKHNLKKVSLKQWERLNDNLIAAYRTIFPFKEEVDHVGTWICLPRSRYPQKSGEISFLREMDGIDCLQKFIVKYGYWKGPEHRREEKMIDTEIVCQMLIGAFRNEYDTCFILSDDADYVPAINRIQDDYGKRVIQVGFADRTMIRAASFGHLPLEHADKQLNVRMPHR